MVLRKFEKGCWRKRSFNVFYGNPVLQSVLKVFRFENYAYYYHHLKENFKSFLTKYNTKDNKGKHHVLEWLDSSLCELDDYNVVMFELRKFNILI